MSESLTINTLNRGRYTYTHRGQGLEWDQVMRIREGELLKKKTGKAPIRAPQGRGRGRSSYPGPASRAGSVSVAFLYPEMHRA